jgi:poly(3-hydroxyalkanoate) synthetase
MQKNAVKMLALGQILPQKRQKAKVTRLSLFEFVQQTDGKLIILPPVINSVAGIDIRRANSVIDFSNF